MKIYVFYLWAFCCCFCRICVSECVCVLASKSKKKKKKFNSNKTIGRGVRACMRACVRTFVRFYLGSLSMWRRPLYLLFNTPLLCSFNCYRVKKRVSKNKGIEKKKKKKKEHQRTTLIHPPIHPKAETRCAKETDRQSENKNEKKKAPNARMRGKSKRRTNQAKPNQKQYIHDINGNTRNILLTYCTFSVCINV